MRRTAAGLVILAAIAAALVLRYCFTTRGHTPPPPAARLTASDNVTLEPPPPVSKGDEVRLAEQIRESRRSLKNALASPGNYGSLVEAARAAIGAGELLTARRCLIRAVRLHPDPDPLVYDLLARCLIELGLYSEACSYSQSAIRKYPSNVLAYVELSRAYEGLDYRDRRAAPLVDAGRAISGQDVPGHMALALEF